MTAIRTEAAACTRAFHCLTAALDAGGADFQSLISPSSLEDEFGRYRVWAGNIGALQKGHSSLDYRLRDSPLLRSNVSKLLRELQQNLQEAIAVVSGKRLPYEKQASPGDFSDDDVSDDSFGDDDSDEDQPKTETELEQRTVDVVDIINNLYKLSIRIRSPTLRTRSLKAAAFKDVDPKTGIDVFSQYAEYDKRHTEDALSHLRKGDLARRDQDVAFLVHRLSRAITKRRQQFKYWKKHRDKLAHGHLSGPEEIHIHTAAPDAQARAVGDVSPENGVQVLEATGILRAPPSEMNPRTLLSGTEATAHHRTLDDAVDSQSVTSVATTARDLSGHGIDLPPPPSTADGEKDFECPYCFVICPARYGRERSWRTHLLQDLQPYVCTYKDCSDDDQLFRSRREWLEHESSAHRKLWRCPSHPEAAYSSKTGIRTHLQEIHGNDLSENHINQVISVAETTAIDTRAYCPVCFADAGTIGNFQHHLANHLERFAAFALPKHVDADENRSAASDHASHGRGSSSEVSHDNSQKWSNSSTASEDNADERRPVEEPPALSLTAENVVDRLLAMLDNLEQSTEPGGRMSEDWSTFRSSLESFFPPQEVAPVLARLDILFGMPVNQPRPNFDSVRSLIRELAPVPAPGTQVSSAPHGARANEAILGEQYPVLDEAQLLAWSTYIKCKHLSGFLVRIREDVFTLHTSLSTLASIPDSRGNILAENVVQTTVGVTETLTKIQQTIDRYKRYPIDENTVESLRMQLAVWIRRVDALVAITKLASLSTSGNSLSAEAVDSVSHSMNQKMESFLSQEKDIDHGQQSFGADDISKGSGDRSFKPEPRGIMGKPNEFEIWPMDDTERNNESSTEQPYGKRSLDPSSTIWFSNLPAGTSEVEIENAFSGLRGFQGFYLNKHDDTTSGYVKFRSVEDAEHASSSLDTSKFPSIRLQLNSAIFSTMESGNTSPPVEDPDAHDRAGFDVSNFLATLFRVLREPGYASLIHWTDKGRNFLILDEEGFAKDLLQPIFELNNFATFRERLITCGFARIAHSSHVSLGELRSSTWYHKYFRRDIPGDQYYICSAVRFQRNVNRAGSSLPKESIGEIFDSKAGAFFYRKSRFTLKTLSDVQRVSDLYINGWLSKSAVKNIPTQYPSDEKLNSVVGYVQHDITMLKIDAIVNAANPALDSSASSSINHQVHKAAGPELLREWQSLGFCEMGQAKITRGYNLPCQKVIHTTRPHYLETVSNIRHKSPLASCYRSCLRVAVENGLRSIAFPCLSAGAFGFPSREAAEIALRTTREFLQSGQGDTLERIVFCVYEDSDAQVYRSLIPIFFPPSPSSARTALYAAPDTINDANAVETVEQHDLHQGRLGELESSKPTQHTTSRLSGSVESLSRLTGGPSLWACCKCRARPMETPHCLICYHELCPSCHDEMGRKHRSRLWLVYLHPAPDMLESPQESGLTSLDRRDLVVHEDKIRGSIRSRPNSPERNYRPTYVKVHRKHVSLDTLFYYDLPFEFDANDQHYITIQRELDDDQTRVLFEHTRRLRRNLSAVTRERRHPDPTSSQPKITLGSYHEFRNESQSQTSIFVPGPFVSAYHCEFYIVNAQWMMRVGATSGRTFLNGRNRTYTSPEQQGAGSRDPFTGWEIKSGDILGLGENDDGKPVYLFRIECDSLASGEDALWEEAEARASRYGFPTIGLDDDAGGGDNDAGPAFDSNDAHGQTSDGSDAEIDPSLKSGVQFIDASTVTSRFAAAGPPATGTRWTKINRRLVNPQALEEAGEEYEDRVRYLLVSREVGLHEVQRLAERTKLFREEKALTEYTKKQRARKGRAVRKERAQVRDRKESLMMGE